MSRSAGRSRSSATICCARRPLLSLLRQMRLMPQRGMWMVPGTQVLMRTREWSCYQAVFRSGATFRWLVPTHGGNALSGQGVPNHGVGTDSRVRCGTEYGTGRTRHTSDTSTFGFEQTAQTTWPRMDRGAFNCLAKDCAPLDTGRIESTCRCRCETMAIVRLTKTSTAISILRQPERGPGGAGSYCTTRLGKVTGRQRHTFLRTSRDMSATMPNRCR